MASHLVSPHAFFPAILHVSHALSLHVGPLETHIRGYNAHWKDALASAIDDLVAEGVMARQGRKIALTAHDKEDVVS